MQMREEKGLTSSHFSNQKVLIHGITNISPHGQIFHEHFKKVIVMNRLLESRQFFLFERFLAEQTPLDVIHKADFVRRGFAAISHNGFSETLTVTHGTLACRSAAVNAHILRLGFFVFFIGCRMLVTKGERIVTVRDGGVIERTVKREIVCEQHDSYTDQHDAANSTTRTQLCSRLGEHHRALCTLFRPVRA
jgi:hypothetical protein